MRLRRSLTTLVGACGMLIAPGCRDPAAALWRIEAGQRAGALTARGSETELRPAYGAAAVVTGRVELGEGETAPGTVLFADDSLRRAEILWRDTVNRRWPTRLIVRGSHSQWRLARDISLGTSLRELERLNGRAFTLAGFGWDYSGVITDWNGGALAALLPEVTLYLDPGPAPSDAAAYGQLLGDHDFSSALPGMQSLNPRVTQIFVDFE